MKKAADYSIPWNDAGGIMHDPREAPRRQRIISLVPSLTETLCAVGGEPRLIGITAFCIWPMNLLKDQRIAKVGGTKTVDRERVLALKPDLVLLNLEENELADIDFFKSRVECYINGVKTVEQGIATLPELGSLIGTLETATALAKKAEAELSAIQLRVAERKALGKASPKIFYPIWRDPWMSISKDTFIHDHLKICGAQNIFAEKPGRYPEITLDEVIAAAPDIVWLPSEPYHFKAKDAAEISKLKALPAAQTCRVELVDGDNVCWFGARQTEGLAYTFRTLWKT
jgi:ABC-type Fe3+-hydroxamate transport system substrate-binding protein